MWALNSIDASRRNRSTLLFSIMDPMEGLLPGAERSDDDDFCIDDMDDYQLFDNIAAYPGDLSDNSSAARGDLEERSQQPKGTKRGPSRHGKSSEKKDKPHPAKETPSKKPKSRAEPSYKVVYSEKGSRNATKMNTPIKATRARKESLAPSDFYHDGYSFELDPELFCAVSSRIEESASASRQKRNESTKKPVFSPRRKSSVASDDGERGSITRSGHLRGYSGQRHHRSCLHDFLTPTACQHSAVRSPQRMSTIRESPEESAMSKHSPTYKLPPNKFPDSPAPNSAPSPSDLKPPVTALEKAKQMILYTIHVLSAALWSDDNTSIDKVCILKNGKVISAAPPLLQVLLKEEPYLSTGVLLFAIWTVLVALFKILSAFHTLYRVLIKPPFIVILFLISRLKLVVHSLCAACLVYLMVSFVDYTEMLRHNELVDEEDPFMFITNGSVENIDFAHLKTITPEEMLAMVRHLRIMLLFPTEIIRRFYDGFDQIYIPKRPDLFIDVIFWSIGVGSWIASTCISYFYHLFFHVVFIFVASFPIVRTKRAKFKYAQTYYATIISLVVVSMSIILSVVKLPGLTKATRWISSLSFLIFFVGGAARIINYLLKRKL